MSLLLDSVEKDFLERLIMDTFTWLIVLAVFLLALYWCKPVKRKK